MNPTSTARPGDQAYSGETKAPTFVRHEPNMSERTTVRQPMPLGGTTQMHDHRARVDPSLGRVRSTFTPPPPIELPIPRPTRRHEDDHHRKVRPSALQNIVKKYDGTGDPHDHVATYRQAIHAEQVRDLHTQVEGFGLTLEGKALTWFQPL